MKKRLTIGLILALSLCMLFTATAFANNTAPSLDLNAKGITLTPPTANQATQAVIDAAARDTFGIYFGGSNNSIATISSIDWDHDGWTEWRDYYTEKRACCETTAYENGSAVYHYSVAYLKTPAGGIVGRHYGYGTGWSHAESDWGYAGFTAITGYGLP